MKIKFFAKYKLKKRIKKLNELKNNLKKIIVYVNQKINKILIEIELYFSNNSKAKPDVIAKLENWRRLTEQKYLLQNCVDKISAILDFTDINIKIEETLKINNILRNLDHFYNLTKNIEHTDFNIALLVKLNSNIYDFYNQFVPNLNNKEFSQEINDLLKDVIDDLYDKFYNNLPSIQNQIPSDEIKKINEVLQRKSNITEELTDK
ncbi:MAG: hypothetical protein ACTSRZ_15665 [Promethearchaeota archaeon]